MQLDSSKLFKPALFFMAIRGIFIFLSMSNFLYIGIGFLYGITFFSVRGNGLKYKYILPVIIADIAFTITEIGIDNITQFIFIYIPLVALFIISIFMIKELQKEYTLFERTVVSFNSDDRILARKALQTLDPEDLSKVAEYTAWKEVL